MEKQGKSDLAEDGKFLALANCVGTKLAVPSPAVALQWVCCKSTANDGDTVPRISDSWRNKPPRTRERLIALYEVARGINASQVARQYGRDNETVQGWVHTYNEHGAQALIYRRSGGRPPICTWKA